jgi:RNA polymerase sigma-70 factor (ECF subfamily)
VNKRAQRSSPTATSTAASAGTAVDDRELVDAARAGDRDAFRTLFDRYQRRAYSLAYGVVRNPDDALDVVQDAFIKAHRYLDKFEGTSSFYTWLYRIVMNLAIDHIRKTKRSKVVDFSDLTVKEDDARVGEEDLLPRILGGNPGRSLMDKEIRARIEAALSELSENHRAVLVMREMEGLSYEEMAGVMGCSKGTIMSRLFHARRNMQKRLLDLYDHPSPELVAELEGKGNGKKAEAAEESAEAVEPSGPSPVKEFTPTRATPRDPKG